MPPPSLGNSPGRGIVTEHMRIHLLLNTGTAGSELAGMTRGLGLNGPIATVPAIAGKQPDAGFFLQTSPVRAEFVEQNGTKHHITVLATLAALDVNHHSSAIDVADLEACQLCVPHTGGVEGHEESSMKRSASRIDKLRHFFLAENRGQAVAFLRIRSVGNAPWLLECLDIEKPQSTQMVGHRTGRQLLHGEVLCESFDQADIALCGSL